MVDPEMFEQLKFAFLGGDKTKLSAVVVQYDPRVWLKGDQHGTAVIRTGYLRHPRNNLLMPDVQAVERADRHHRVVYPVECFDTLIYFQFIIGI